MKDAFIYGLVDPLTMRVRYVGKTSNIHKRYLAHVSANYNNTKKECWLKSLKAKGVSPGVIILDKVIGESWQIYEIKWINHFKSISNSLTNGTNGGEGGAMSPEVLKTISAKKTGVKIKRTKKENCNKGRGLSGAHKAAISAAKLGSHREDRQTFVKLSRLFSIPISQHSRGGEFIKIWHNAGQAAKALNINSGNIASVCNMKRKSAGGFLWKKTKEAL